MRNIKVGRTVAAPQANVWAVLADYPNIDAWNDGVQNSYAIGEATEGVGAQRYCELTPSGAMRETVREWVPEEKMAISLDQIKKVPLKAATMTFTLADSGENTAFMMSYDYDPKGGPLAFVVAAMLSRPMKKGFNGFIDNLETAAQAPATG